MFNQVKLDAFVLFVFIITFKLSQLLIPSSDFLVSISIAAFLAIYALLIVVRSKCVIKHILKPRVFLVLSLWSLSGRGYWKN